MSRYVRHPLWVLLERVRPTALPFHLSASFLLPPSSLSILAHPQDL
jgi:hypothetical protein